MRKEGTEGSWRHGRAKMVTAVQLGLCPRQAAVGLSVPSHASLSPWGSSKMLCWPLDEAVHIIRGE